MTPATRLEELDKATRRGYLPRTLATLIELWLADAWAEGHRAGRDYQGDGWNSDAHDPEDDNPYRRTEATS
jgi:hypothetical protein